MLELSDEDERPASPPPAPTTSALPAGRKKHTRRKEAAAEDAGDEDAPIALGKRRQRAWEENSGERGLPQLVKPLTAGTRLGKHWYLRCTWPCNLYIRV